MSGPEAPATEKPALASWVVVVMVAAIGLNLRASLGSIPPLLGQLEGALT